MKITIRVVIAALSAFMSIAPASSSEEDYPGGGMLQVANERAFKEAFARLKRLEGTWDEAEYGRVIEYRLTGKGSALIEEFVGDPPMTSVYHLDGNELRLTHYCNAGNQPRMKGASYDGDNLKFNFLDVTNLSAPDAYHTRTLDIEFHDDDHVVLKFVGRKENREIATTHIDSTATCAGRPAEIAVENYRSQP